MLERKVPRVGDENMSYYLDDNHLSNAGAQRLVDTLKKAIETNLDRRVAVSEHYETLIQ